MFPNKPFLKTQAYKMIGFGAWKLTWGNHFVRSRFSIFLGVHRCFLGNHTKPGAQPICKPLTMDVCKVNSWVPYKMVALGQGGKCAGGWGQIIYIYIYISIFIFFDYDIQRCISCLAWPLRQRHAKTDG